MRPIYVTRRDRTNEAAALAKFVAWLNLKFGSAAKVYSGKLAIDFAPFDWEIAINGVPASVVEYKRRTGPSTRHDCWHIAKKKIEAINAAAGTRTRALAFEWDDGLFVANFTAFETQAVEKIGGRFDRGDSADVEPMLDLPRASFQRVVL